MGAKPRFLHLQNGKNNDFAGEREEGLTRRTSSVFKASDFLDTLHVLKGVDLASSSANAQRPLQARIFFPVGVRGQGCVI